MSMRVKDYCKMGQKWNCYSRKNSRVIMMVLLPLDLIEEDKASEEENQV